MAKNSTVASTEASLGGSIRGAVLFRLLILLSNLQIVLLIERVTPEMKTIELSYMLARALEGFDFGMLNNRYNLVWEGQICQVDIYVMRLVP
jgi:hypothetical protein